MKRVFRASLVIAIAMVFAETGIARAAEIGNVPWTESNVQTLETFSKPHIVRFVNEVSGNEGTILASKEGDIGDFTWADLAGNGNYQLLVVYDVNGRGFFNDLAIYTQEIPGKIVRSDIEGWGIGWDLSKVVRDLNSDGVKELIIPKVLISHSTADTLTWPSIYRMKYGKYVEASREFPSYYDYEVLPEIERGIARAEAIEPPTPASEYEIAAGLLLKYKILRMLRRDPNAGLAEARAWMKSDSAQLLQFAAATFAAIPGHEAEMREAQAAQRRALCREHPGMVMCDKAAVERQVREACRSAPHMTVCKSLPEHSPTPGPSGP
jgi:hypothetical protein